jgi:hypothetical protein
MIQIYNPDKLSKHPFFKDLVNFLYSHKDVTLRKIKSEFPDVSKIDRHIEDYVNAGYILRQEKRYDLNVSLLTDAQDVTLDQQIFVDTDSQAFEKLRLQRFETQLSNPTNQVILIEETSITRDELTLANYFYKLQNKELLSKEQLRLYHLLGDVNQDYALKYMTSFLLKFASREQVSQKRPDVFVESLELLSYIIKNDIGKYELKAILDEENMRFLKTLTI